MKSKHNPVPSIFAQGDEATKAASVPSGPRRILVATALVLVGLALVLVVPTACEGPLLLYISEQHAIRLVDALGLSLAVPAWLYLNLIAVRSWIRRRKHRKAESEVEDR